MRPRANMSKKKQFFSSKAIRPSAKILRFFGSQPGHLFMHKKNDDVKKDPPLDPGSHLFPWPVIVECQDLLYLYLKQ